MLGLLSIYLDNAMSLMLVLFKLSVLSEDERHKFNSMTHSKNASENAVEDSRLGRAVASSQALAL